MNKYDKEKIIGSGTFGTVWIAKSRLSRVSYVLKEIDLNSMDDIDVERAFLEAAVLSKFKHKNIIKYKEAIMDHHIGKLHIIMEYAEGGDLSSAIKKQNGIPFTEDLVLSWFIQICLALQYIHYNNVLHRDLKSQNIFLTRNKIIKVGDFGISRLLKSSEDLATTCIGTPYYLSPEICQRKPYNYKSDMWALGCTLFELSALEHPFKATNFVQLVNLILDRKRRELPSWSSPLIHNLVEKLLSADPDKRPSADEVLANHNLQPYLSKYVFDHASRETASFLVTTTERSFVGVNNIYENSLKRRASISPFNPKAPKLFVTSPEKDVNIKVVDQAAFSARCAIPTKIPKPTPSKSRKPSPSKSPQNKEDRKEITNFVINSNTKRLPDSQTGKSEMNITYIISEKSQELDQSATELLTDCFPTKEFDCGYQSEEAMYQIGTTSSSRTKLNSDGSNHHHCQHAQCHQCVLEMLWKNRIRVSDTTSVNPDEYSRLRNKLLSVFKGNLFQKVYHSFLCDWERNEINSSRVSIRSFINTLNYEQVQNLPLMMQLIQLDLLTKSSEERDTLPSIVL